MKKPNFKLSAIGMVIIAIFCIGNLSAQEKTIAGMLQEKEWVMQFPHKVEFSMEIKFIGNDYVGVFKFEGKEVEARSPYYLSDEVNWMFNEQKVGCTENGKYIIVNENRKNPKTGPYKEVIIYEILKLTETELQLKNLRNNSILSYKSEEVK